jgi:Ran GTPase-activating protein (RanGAP) involved in mRNA processing and transport
VIGESEVPYCTSNSLGYGCARSWTPWPSTMVLTLSNQWHPTEVLKSILHALQVDISETSIRLASWHLEERKLFRAISKLVLDWRDWDSFAIFCWKTTPHSEALIQQICDYEVFRSILLKGADAQTLLSMTVVLIHPELCELHLSNFFLSKEQAESLHQGLQQTKKLRTLRLNHFRFSMGSLVEVAGGLHVNTSLQTLDLANNRLNDKTLCTIFQSIQGHPSLGELDLNVNYIRRRGLLALAKLLNSKDCRLNRISLELNRIETVDAFLDELTRNTSLATLSFSRNYLTSASISLIISHVYKLESLEDLNLSSNNIAQTLELSNVPSVPHKSLKRLDLSMSGMTLDTIDELLCNLYRFPGLQVLDLSHNRTVSLHFSRSISKTTLISPSLRRLVLGRILEQDKIYLLKIMRLCPRLVDIGVPLRSLRDSYLRRRVEHILDTRRFVDLKTEISTSCSLWPTILAKWVVSDDFDAERHANLVYALLQGPAFSVLVWNGVAN